MSFQIEVVDVAKEQGTTKTGKPYTSLNVAYRKDGKIEGKKIFPFGDKNIYDTVAKANKGDVFTVVSEKNEGGFWEWTSITSGANVPVQSTAPTGTQSSAPKTAGFVSPKSTYETPEERAVKQEMIVRQSSLSNSISLLKTDKKNPTLDEVFVAATAMFNWVMNKPTVAATPPKLEVSTTTFDTLHDDVPWNNDNV